MQIHVLGGGAIGQLLAFHLTRTLRAAAAASGTTRAPPAYLQPYLPSPESSGTTIHIRNPGIAQRLSDEGGIVTLEHNGIQRSEEGLVIQGGLGALPDAPPATLPPGTRTSGPNSRMGWRRWKRIMRASAEHQLRQHELTERDLARSGVSLFEPHRGPDAHIDALFLCTKADTASFALESLLPRLSARSTLVLTQNGLGLADVLIAKHFPDPEHRPFIILSSLTHGLYRTRQSNLHAVHASLGEIHFGVIPDRRFHGISGGMEQPAPWPSEAEEDSTSQQRRATWPPDTLTLEHIQRHFEIASSNPARHFAHRDPSLEPPPHEASSLVQTIALLLGAEELKASWVPMPDFHRRALRKLAINACINPLTALLECQNGALVANHAPTSVGTWDDEQVREQSAADRERGAECRAIMRDVCQEISAVVQERAERSWWASKSTEAAASSTDAEVMAPAAWSAADVLVSSAPSSSTSTFQVDAVEEPPLLAQGLTDNSQLPSTRSDGPPPLHPTLTADALFAEVERVLLLVKDNFSSMYQDVVLHGRASSEITFVNGYVRRLADALNEERFRVGTDKMHMKAVNTPINRMLERLVVAKCDLFGSLGLHSSASASHRAEREQGHNEKGAESSVTGGSSNKMIRSPSFPTFPSRKFDLSKIRVPDRERVGQRKNRAGGHGRLWEYRKLIQLFREKEKRVHREETQLHMKHH
ncbi:2-dehydropantoate 2-reductase (Ketopantoate reductase) (KPA reductase) (KPR) [Tilletia horrida]|nr:2-dehydropantoate 2-reductase (Ketopantoate reductase) (KPA reductase) (KPR) [Tilletia horrida]